MSSRWPEDAVIIVSACLLEAIWLGALGAAADGRGAWSAVAFAFVVIGAAAGIAVRVRESRWEVFRSRLAAVGLILAATALLIAARRQPLHNVHQVAAALLQAVAYCSAAAWLGVLNGRAEMTTDELQPRVVRASALVFVVLFLAAATHHPVGGSGGLIVMAVLAGVVVLAAGRLCAVLTAVGSEQGRRAWAWLLAVVVAAAAILLVAAGLVGAVAHDAVLWPFVSGYHLLVHARDGLAWVAYWAAYGVARAITAVWHALPVHPHVTRHALPASATSAKATTKPSPAPHPSALVRVIATVVFGLAAAVVALAIVIRALHYVGVHRPREEDEERESLLTAEGVAGSAARGVRGALRRLAPRREGRPRTPAEAVRREYRSLEQSLARRGHARAPSVTVRRFLGAAAGAAAAAPAAALYERARYAAEGVSTEDVGAFRAAAAALLEALVPPPPSGPRAS